MSTLLIIQQHRNTHAGKSTHFGQHLTRRQFPANPVAWRRKTPASAGFQALARANSI
ncbi:MAG: hypothetical protein JSR69_20360 [Proteobacteria bacterium]|nr:hypothetical protein [Pseudomonadota bacterium]